MAVSANATLCNTASTLYANDGTSRTPEMDMILYTVSLTLSDPASKESKSSAGRMFQNCFARSPKPAVLPPTVRIAYLFSLRALGKPYQIPVCKGSCTKIFPIISVSKIIKA